MWHKTLGCWCYNLPCHGDVLKELVEKHVKVKLDGISQDLFCIICCKPNCVSNLCESYKSL